MYNFKYNNVNEIWMKDNKEKEKECYHEKCSECHGTGKKTDGSICVHHISCPCPKHSLRC